MNNSAIQVNTAFPQSPNLVPLSDAWKSAVQAHFPNLEHVFQVCLANCAACLLKDLSGCPSVILEGPPSSGKNTVLNCFDVSKVIYRTDNFTPKSFVSHVANTKRSQLAQIDLLPRLQYKIATIKDLAPFFGGRADDLREKIGILTRVLDGDGYLSDSGTYGQRGYTGDYRFGLLGGTTPLKNYQWDVMGSTGPRLLFYKLTSLDEPMAARVNQLVGNESYKDKSNDCRNAISPFIDALWSNAGGFGGYDWNRQNDNIALVELIVKLADFASKLRGKASQEKSNVIGDSGYEFTPAVIEGSERLQSMLYNIARGNALASLRGQIDMDDVKLAAKVCISSTPQPRYDLLKGILNANGPLDSSSAASLIGCSLPTARKIARELALLGVLDVSGKDENFSAGLKPEHNWIRNLL